MVLNDRIVPPNSFLRLSNGSPHETVAPGMYTRLLLLGALRVGLQGLCKELLENAELPIKNLPGGSVVSWAFWQIL